MLGTDYLFRLERYLDEQNTLDRSVIDELNSALSEIHSLDSYQTWLNEPAAFALQYVLPRNFGSKLPDRTKRLLDRFKIINGSTLEVKIDEHNSRIHLTDGAWVPANYRVFPYADESALLCDYVIKKGYHQTADLLIDPACGCGHHGLGLSAVPTRLYLDINLRALAFCRINSLLCNSSQMLSGLNDLRGGLPRIVNMINSKYTLIVVNMPFGIFPKEAELPTTLAQDGGDRGVALTFAAMDAVKGLVEKSSHINEIRFAILFYSLGYQKNGNWNWEVVDRARNLFGTKNVAHEILENQKMWRVNGVKTEENPMKLDRMKTKGMCSQTYSIADKADAIAGYEKLEELYRRSGYTHLGYGILDINAKSQG